MTPSHPLRSPGRDKMPRPFGLLRPLSTVASSSLRPRASAPAARLASGPLPSHPIRVGSAPFLAHLNPGRGRSAPAMGGTSPRRHISASAAAQSGQQGFDGELSAIYSQLFDQNHPAWKEIADAAAPRLTGAGPFSVLDLAAGPGEPSCTIASAFPGAKVICTDVSEDMISKARARAVEKGVDGGMEFGVLDGCDMAGVADGSVDVIVACYGFMFMEDLDKALREVKRVLKPDGLLVTTVWNSISIMSFIRDAMTKVLGSPPPPPASCPGGGHTPRINPMSLADPALFEGRMPEAGLEVIESRPGTYSFEMPADPEVAWKAVMLPALPKVQELHDSGKYGDVNSVVRQHILSVTEEYVTPAGTRRMPPSTFRLVVAKPKA